MCTARQLAGTKKLFHDVRFTTLMLSRSSRDHEIMAFQCLNIQLINEIGKSNAIQTNLRGIGYNRRIGVCDKNTGIKTERQT